MYGIPGLKDVILMLALIVAFIVVDLSTTLSIARGVSDHAIRQNKCGNTLEYLFDSDWYQRENSRRHYEEAWAHD